jgi:hypothetical protein
LVAFEVRSTAIASPPQLETQSVCTSGASRVLRAMRQKYFVGYEVPHPALPLDEGGFGRG